MHGDCSSLLQELAVVAAGLEAAALSACCRWFVEVCGFVFFGDLQVLIYEREGCCRCCYDVAREGVVLPASCRFMVMATRWCKRLVPVAVLQVPGALPWWTAWSR
ncbi:hypothetical protein DEO72_LG3g628 [Vigna unguiculata]|uniref:Uncharacterized protein n=1 Tax=Vigna unguiculata TaxID=3917 RepID=A0A4D6LC27_VIGUN|nr:hypothetical protein DEO72_LG3g628 [Vigna unguiculata]